jgi:hypothetical protein
MLRMMNQERVTVGLSRNTSLDMTDRRRIYCVYSMIRGGLPLNNLDKSQEDGTLSVALGSFFADARLATFCRW